METSKQKVLQNQRFRQLAKVNPSAILSFPLICILRVYKLCVSPLLGPHCRFEPTCSSFAIDAIKTYGIGKGIFLSLNRLRKCHPWHTGGYDPVPSKPKDNKR